MSVVHREEDGLMRKLREKEAQSGCVQELVHMLGDSYLIEENQERERGMGFWAACLLVGVVEEWRVRAWLAVTCGREMRQRTSDGVRLTSVSSI